VSNTCIDTHTSSFAQLPSVPWLFLVQPCSKRQISLQTGLPSCCPTTSQHWKKLTNSFFIHHLSPRSRHATTPFTARPLFFSHNLSPQWKHSTTSFTLSSVKAISINSTKSRTTFTETSTLENPFLRHLQNVVRNPRHFFITTFRTRTERFRNSCIPYCVSNFLC